MGNREKGKKERKGSRKVKNKVKEGDEEERKKGTGVKEREGNG